MSTSVPARREKNGRLISWIGLLLGGGLSAMAVVVVDIGILWDHSTGCAPGPADPGEVLAGQLWTAGVLVVVGALWTFTVRVLPEHRPAAATSALVAVLPALAFVAHGLSPASWVGGFCIPF